MRRRNSTTRGRAITALAATAIVMFALAGCTSGSGASDEAGYAGLPAEPAPANIESGESSAVGDAASDRQVISQGSMSITAENPITAADDAAMIVERAGGRIDSRNEYPATDSDDTASADLVARIPSSTLTATLADIVKLGELEQRQLTKTDVTTETQDLDARITVLRTSTDRLTALLASATTTKDLIDIESSLSTRQGELESLEAQRRGLADQVDLATVSITFGSEATAPIDTPDTFLSGLVTGWESLTAFIGAVLVALGVALPWLVVLAVIAFVVLALVRRRQRTRPSPVTMGE